MTKDSIIKARVSDTMLELATVEAERRGMNLSEFVRFVLALFFEDRDDSKPQNNEGIPQ